MQLFILDRLWQVSVVYGCLYNDLVATDGVSAGENALVSGSIDGNDAGFISAVYVPLQRRQLPPLPA